MSIELLYSCKEKKERANLIGHGVACTMHACAAAWAAINQTWVGKSKSDSARCSPIKADRTRKGYGDWSRVFEETVAQRRPEGSGGSVFLAESRVWIEIFCMNACVGIF